MKILHVITECELHHGGPSINLINLVEEQNKMGFLSHIATTHSKFNSYKSKNFQTVKKFIYSFKTNFPKSINYSKEFKKFIDNNISNYDILHIHGLYRYPVSYAAYKSGKLKIPYIIRPHGSLDPFLHNKSNNSLILKKCWRYFIDFPNLKKCNAIHATSQMEKIKIKKLRLNNKIFINSNFISSFFFEKKLKKKPKKNYNYILFLGRINFKKGLDILIPAFKKISDEYKNYKLLLVGPNNERYLQIKINPLIKKYNISKKVKYHKPIYGKKLLGVYNRSILFILPSYTENFGNTVIEAMSQGIPVVISNNLDLSSQFKKHKIAKICKCEVKSLYDSIKSVISNKKDTLIMKKKAMKYVSNNFASATVLKKLNNIYLKILKKNFA
jgi:glycosyltransferase involved in cell wall biosynthesis